MKLYHAKPSPFARRVRVLLRERGLLSRIDEIATAPWDSPAELLAVNPASKVTQLQPSLCGSNGPYPGPRD